ncbi:MAG TPA: GNAT family N-acetyltransferase [Actinomycetota bacterium]|nr:GNAT family N-acetyltransferase [Actinomycetota bacterium]
MDDVRALFERAVRFEHELQDRSAERTETFRWGRAIFNDTCHRVYDLNALRLEQTDPEPTVEGLVEEADRLHGAAGHEHRRLVVDDAELGERLAPGFRAAGWEVRRFLYMGQLREPDDAEIRAEVRELDEATHWEAKRWFMSGAPEAFDDLVVTQLLERDRLKAANVDFRRFGVEADGRAVSVCELYSDGATAQVEDVSTQEPYRGRGYARATVLTAARTGRDLGCDFVFLVADHDDCPKALYAKLGFDPLGVVYDFLKLPPGEKLP